MGFLSDLVSTGDLIIRVWKGRDSPVQNTSCFGFSKNLEKFHFRCSDDNPNLLRSRSSLYPVLDTMYVLWWCRWIVSGCEHSLLWFVIRTLWPLHGCGGGIGWEGKSCSHYFLSFRTPNLPDSLSQRLLSLKPASLAGHDHPARWNSGP